jgi:hypothetical protein
VGVGGCLILSGFGQSCWGWFFPAQVPSFFEQGCIFLFDSDPKLFKNVIICLFSEICSKIRATGYARGGADRILIQDLNLNEDVR